MEAFHSYGGERFTRNPYPGRSKHSLHPYVPKYERKSTTLNCDLVKPA